MGLVSEITISVDGGSGVKSAAAVTMGEKKLIKLQTHFFEANFCNSERRRQKKKSPQDTINQHFTNLHCFLKTRI